MNKQPTRRSEYAKAKRGFGKPFALVASAALLAASVVGGTLAFLSMSTPSVVNTFELGDIEYTLTLSANAKQANAKYSDSDVTMPQVAPGAKQDNLQTAAQVAAAGHVDFNLSIDDTADGEPKLAGYDFLGWYYDTAGNSLFAGVSGTK